MFWHEREHLRQLRSGSNNVRMDMPFGSDAEQAGPHLIYQCSEASESPWAVGDFLGLTLTEENNMIVHLSKSKELIGVYGCPIFPFFARDALAGRLRVLWAAPVIRRMRQAELSRSLASVPKNALEPLRLMA